MKIHYIQHVNFETPGAILEWTHRKGASVFHTFSFNNAPFPSLNDVDALVIMGGPMNIYEDNKYSWLKKEKHFINRALLLKKKIFGICLGAQLLADVLGAKVYKNSETEIGISPVYLTKEIQNHSLFQNIPSSFMALHWHGDTFAIPKGAIRIAKNEVSQNQGFMYNNQALALQFHIEVNENSLSNLLINSQEDLKKTGPFIQSEEMIRSSFRKHQKEMKKNLFNILDNFF